MYAAQRKVLTLLHDHKVTVDEAEELMDAMETPQTSPTPSIPKVELTGESEWTRKFRKALDQIAVTESPVVIQGETGTGKALIARILHYNSRRSHGPFVPFHCPPAVANTLIDSEIFGHEQGAFTGAVNQKRGLLDAANEGTILFDEIEALPLETQHRLTSFLEDGYFTRVGGTKPIYADARVMGATHGDLKQYVDEGKVRSDFYYRLSVCLVQSAPLRERLEDLPILAKHFVEEQAKRDGKKPPKLSEEAMEMLHAYHWPENHRELSHMMEKAVVLCDRNEITPEHLPALANSGQ